LGHATKKCKGCNRAVQDRLGLLAWQRDHKGGVRVSPRHQQDRDRASA
jgi:hypothetical protein